LKELIEQHNITTEGKYIAGPASNYVTFSIKQRVISTEFFGA